MCFLCDDNDPGNTLPVLVLREGSSRMTMAAAVPLKMTGTCISKRVVASMKEVGVVDGDVSVRSDQESAMKAFLSDLGRVRAAEGGGRYVMEQSPVACSASNGIAERAIQSVEDPVKVLKSAV